MSTREIIFSLILLALATILWQLLKNEEPEVIVNPISQDAIPGYYLDNAKLTRYNTNGQAEYTISAEKIEQDLVTNNLNLSKIQVNYHTQGNWTIEAENAVLPATRELISFSGNVIASQGSQSNTSFKSDSLSYDIADQMLSTKDSIQATNGQQLITATGMTLDMKNERINLLSRVKIRYIP